MKAIIRILRIVTILTIFTVLGSGTVMAATVEGTVQGLYCVSGCRICPIDDQDPHFAAEKNFVVLTEGQGYHFVTNIDRYILARYFLKKVRVSGRISSKYKAITADKLEIFMNGKWKTKWTMEIDNQQSGLLTGG